jgi:site-specific DNA-cytosine methylase
MNKLTTLDLYSGCGGLTCGLENSGLAETKWAVEKNKDAADTFATNFPGSKVFNEEVSMWFENVKVYTQNLMHSTTSCSTISNLNSG